MSEDITKRLMDLSETMMEGMPYNDGDFTILDEACSEIERLREQLRVMTEEHRYACEDRDEIRRERDEARRLYCERMSPGDPPRHAERWNWDCYGAFEDREKLKFELQDAAEERDEARRECCTWQGLESGRRKQDVAASRGWGYLKWPDQDALDRLAKLDEEMGF